MRGLKGEDGGGSGRSGGGDVCVRGWVWGGGGWRDICFCFKNKHLFLFIFLYIHLFIYLLYFFNLLETTHLQHLHLKEVHRKK